MSNPWWVAIEDNAKTRNILPEGLQQAQRSFSIIRVHQGVAGVLPDLDDNPATITVATDRFSAYTLVYEKAATNVPGGTGGSDGCSPQTGDSGRLTLWQILAGIASAGMCGGILAVRKKRIF